MSPPPQHRPRIAFLGARGVPARYGGFETFVEEIGARLAERGVDVTVFCERDKGEPEGPAEYRGMDLRYVKAWAPGPARTIQVDVSGLARAMRGFDVVYLLGYGAAFAAWLPRMTGTSVWINPDGIEWQRSKWGGPARAWLALMERMACRAASRLVIDNGALADNIGARARMGQHSVLAYGAETLDEELPDDAVRALGLTPGEYDLLVCRFEPENHVDEILQAHERANTGRPLVAVAHTDTGTPYATRTMDRASGAARDGRVRFLGAIYDPEVLLPLRQHSGLYLHGHSVGGTNPSLLEAMGAGNVVLAHDNPFNREVLGEQDVYWDGIEALTQRISDWAGRAEVEIQGVRDRNLARIRSDYCWDQLADDYAALIRADAKQG